MRKLPILVTAFCASFVIAAPPTIVSMTPSNGATNVDPSLSEVSVTFDQPMSEGFSWTGSGPAFPKSPDGAKVSWSADLRTCRFPVVLEANRTYLLGINSKSHQGFRNAAGEPAEPTLFVFATSGSVPGEATQGEVLLNDSFEEGGTKPAGWEDRGISGVKLSWDKRLAKTGDRSLKLSKTANRYFPIASWARRVEHRKGDAKALRVEAEVKANKAKKVVLDALFLDADAKSISHEWTSYIGEDDANPDGVTCDWTSFSGTTAIPDGTAFIELSVQIYGPGTVWVDDMTATYVARE